MQRVIAKTKSYIVLMLAVLVVVAWTLVLGSRPVDSDNARPVRVVIAQGLSAKGIAQVLKDAEIIRSPFMFVLTCRASGMSTLLRPGVYQMNRSMALPEVVRKLVDGESLESWLTVPEGYNIRQIADLVDSKKLARGNAFVRLAIERSYEFPAYAFVYGNGLEGYLFPDTYLIARGGTPEAIITKMLDAFESKVVRELRPQIEQAAQARFNITPADFPLGLHKILTMAAMVEREAKVDEDRGLIAAVLWNRLATGMRLQVDATVSYVPGESRNNKDRVYHNDLKRDSPYNTYTRGGLPPGPICNPGLESIKAVLEPADADYLYYVAKPDGSHVFSRTLAEHEAAKRAVRRTLGDNEAARRANRNGTRPGDN